MSEEKTNKWRIAAMILFIVLAFENAIIFYGLVSLVVDYNKDQDCQDKCELIEDCAVGYYDVDLETCDYVSQEILDYLNSIEPN